MAEHGSEGIEIVCLPMGRIEEFVNAASVAFSFDPDDDIVASTKHLDPRRVIAALDGDRVVGTAASLRYPVTVPGGAHLTAAGVTFVTVLPSHRRRGVLTSMMRRLLDEAHERNEPLASLWASEAPIYGRFGFGEAVEMVRYRIKKERSAFRAPVAPMGSVFIIDADEALARLPAFHDGLDWVGKFGRDGGYWRHWVMWDPEFDRDGFTKRRIAVYEAEGAVAGYVFFRTKWTDSGGTVRVDELVAGTPDAEVALHRFVFGIDLIDLVELRGRRPDEPVKWMLEDTRALKRDASEHMWFRLLDLATCLRGRTYEQPGSLVLDVTDLFAPWNHGTWRLTVDGDGAECEPSAEPPDIGIDTADLAALYMGGRSALTMAAAGRVAGSPDAVARLDGMFRLASGPWSPESY